MDRAIRPVGHLTVTALGLHELWLRLDTQHSTHGKSSRMEPGFGNTGGHLSLEEQQLLVMRYAPLVRKIARSLPGTAGIIEFEDAVGYGMCGLVEAVRRYRPEGAGNFQAYATKRIRGSMVDALRRADRLTRTMREKAQAAQRARSELERATGGSVTSQQVAARMGVSRAEYAADEATGRWATVSLDQMLAPGDDSSPSPAVEMPIADEDIDFTRLFERRELHNELTRAIAGLPERERLVVALYYVEQLSMKDVSAVLGVSETRASQLHGQALRRLRAALTEQAA